MDTSKCRQIVTEIYAPQQLLNDSSNGDKNMEEFEECLARGIRQAV